MAYDPDEPSSPAAIALLDRMRKHAALRNAGIFPTVATKPDEPISPAAAEMLERYRRRGALQTGDFKRIMIQYFEVADEYTDRTGKTPPPVIFNIVPPTR